MKFPTALIAMLMALFVIGSVQAAPAAQNEPPPAGVVTANSNLRRGPSIAFPVVGFAPQGTSVEIIACNADCTWYQLESGEWIAAFLVDAIDVPIATDTPAAHSTTGLTLTLVSWNVESGGALQSAVADRIAAFDGVDIWGLSEVSAVDAEAYEFGAEAGENADFDSLLGTTGRSDRLLLIWNSERFALVDSGEMLAIGETGRAPLWAQLRERISGVEFIVMVNHLHRSNDGIRHRQAAALNTWAATQKLPILAMGDYNFDYAIGGSSWDRGFDNLTASGVWEWVMPTRLVTTQCSGWPCQYHSILDFIFVAGPARDWDIVSEIVVTEGDFPDDFTTPDHRPVMAVVNGSSVSVPTVQPTTIPPAATNAPATVACPQPNGNVNLRDGPGTAYAIVGRLSDGECITIAGRNAEGNWYQLDNGSWVAAFLIVNAPAIRSISVVDTPAPPPTNTPTPASPGIGCDPSYPDVCIAPPPPDLDCDDVPFTRFRVVGADPHRFDNDGDGIGCEGGSAVPVPVQPTPVPPTATPVPPPPEPQEQCDPNYAGACIPIVGYDLDCGDIPFRRFQSVGSDPHNFDGDGDGLACER